MKKYVADFFHRGFVACGFGPLVLVVFYLVLQHHCDVQTLTVHEVCRGIVSLSALAFVAGGTNILYQIERLPLMLAILIHGGVLYISYLVTYLINGWLEQGAAPVFAFSVIFVIGYVLIWWIIFSITKKRTARLNAILKEKQQASEDTPR